MGSTDDRLKEANGRLKAGNYRVSIEKIGRQLFLRATLPPKPKSNQSQPHQQRISIAAATPDGVKIAEKEAKNLRLKLDSKDFRWSDYIDSPCPIFQPQNIGTWISEFEKDYFQRRPDNFKTRSTWRVEYHAVFKTLDASSDLTADVLKSAILETEPDTRTRKRFCLTLGALAKFASVDFDPSPYAGNYSQKSRKRRDLPTDKTIVDWYNQIEDCRWQWVFGMLATYGLRNHEVFFLDFDTLLKGDRILSVLQGKTGFRQVWPFHPEWFDQFQLQNVKIPDINLDRNNSAIGGTVSQRFRRNEKLPFKVYDLRHCWAIRTLEYGIDVSLASQQMGHSLAVHSNLYHTWIKSQHHQRAFELAINKSDRPLPPEIKY